MLFPIQYKSLFHDVQQEMLATIKRDAFWPYVGFRVSEFLAKGGVILGFAMLLCYMTLAAVMQRTMLVSPDVTKKLVESVAAFVFAFMGTGIVATVIYKHLWKQMQHVVRAAARGIQG